MTVHEHVQTSKSVIYQNSELGAAFVVVVSSESVVVLGVESCRGVARSKNVGCTRIASTQSASL